jgi:hypothetical protein
MTTKAVQSSATLITAFASEILTSRGSTQLVHIKKKVQSVKFKFHSAATQLKKMQGYISENLRNKADDLHTPRTHELVSLLDRASSCLYVQSILGSQEAVNSVVKQASERSCE